MRRYKGIVAKPQRRICSIAMHWGRDSAVEALQGIPKFPSFFSGKYFEIILKSICILFKISNSLTLCGQFIVIIAIESSKLCPFLTHPLQDQLTPTTQAPVPSLPSSQSSVRWTGYPITVTGLQLGNLANWQIRVKALALYYFACAL